VIEISQLNSSKDFVLSKSIDKKLKNLHTYAADSLDDSQARRIHNIGAGQQRSFQRSFQSSSNPIPSHKYSAHRHSQSSPLSMSAHPIGAHAGLFQDPADFYHQMSRRKGKLQQAHSFESNDSKKLEDETNGTNLHTDYNQSPPIFDVKFST